MDKGNASLSSSSSFGTEDTRKSLPKQQRSVRIEQLAERSLVVPAGLERALIRGDPLRTRRLLRQAQCSESLRKAFF